MISLNMLNINIKLISFAGLLILSTISNIIFQHFQNTLALSLPGPLDKIFGGLFQKLQLVLIIKKSQLQSNKFIKI